MRTSGSAAGAPKGRGFREHLARLARAHGIELESLTEVRGHRLPMRRLGTPAGAGRTLLVGDAAGLVDPLSGDGMYEAFVSARLAADAIVTGDLGGYTAALSAMLDRHASASWAAKRAFDRHPRAVFAAARAPGGVPCGRRPPLRRGRAPGRRARHRAGAAQARRAARGTGSLLRERLREQRRRVGRPREVRVGSEELERLARAAKARNLVAERAEARL